jgi:hypothetical protein
MSPKMSKTIFSKSTGRALFSSDKKIEKKNFDHTLVSHYPSNIRNEKFTIKIHFDMGLCEALKSTGENGSSVTLSSQMKGQQK